MFRFFFKKNFFDSWDNLLHIVLVNLVFIVLFLLFLCAGTFAVAPASDKPFYGILNFAFILLSSIVFSILVFAEGKNAADIASYRTPKFLSLFTNIPPTLRVSLPFGLLSGVLINVALVSIPYYYSMWVSPDAGAMRYLYVFLMAFIFWFLVVTVLAFQWFVPVNALMGDSFFKCLKKSYILFFDNVGFSLGLFLVNVLNLILTVFSVGIVASATGVLITCTNALRLRLYKYDWLEVNPDLSPAERRQVPWEELLKKDRDTVGDRTIKNLFFPWK